MVFNAKFMSLSKTLFTRLNYSSLRTVIKKEECRVNISRTLIYSNLLHSSIIRLAAHSSHLAAVLSQRIGLILLIFFVFNDHDFEYDRNASLTAAVHPFDVRQMTKQQANTQIVPDW